MGADESVLLVRCADVRDVREHPVLYGGYNDGANCSRNDLNGKHSAWWDLHVMTKLQVTRKSNGLVCASICNHLENGIGNRATRKHVASNEFVHYLKGYSLVGDGLEHGKWEG